MDYYYRDSPPSSLSPPADDDEHAIYRPSINDYPMDIQKSQPNHHHQQQHTPLPSHHHPHHHQQHQQQQQQHQQQQQQHWSHIPYASPPASSPFLQDLYEPLPPLDDHLSSDSPGNSSHMQYPSPPPPHMYKPVPDWNMGGPISSLDHPDAYYRRATYPYARQDDHQPHLSSYPHPIHHQQPIHHPHHIPPVLDPSGFKIEHSSPVVVPTQHILPSPSPYYGQPDSRPGSSHSHLSDGSGYIPSHPAPTIMHTSDAASKETQWLRRRCFNCHQTEPPSWRRSTLNPGKIVCNKCGLYERTHLRARPHRFDELRANTKARKASQQAASQTPVANKQPSPKSRPLAPPSYIKKEPHEYPLPQSIARHRRGSTASTASSGVSGNQSDWDESASSVYDPNSSVSSSVYSSPHVGPYNIPTQPSPPPPSSYESSHSLPIQIPSAPIVGGSAPVPAQPEPPSTAPPLARAHTPLKSHTTPYYPERRNHMDRRFTTGNVPQFDSPHWDNVNVSSTSTAPATAAELETEAPAATV